jgi:hypothetical protein
MQSQMPRRPPQREPLVAQAKSPRQTILKKPHPRVKNRHRERLRRAKQRRFRESFSLCSGFIVLARLVDKPYCFLTLCNSSSDEELEDIPVKVRVLFQLYARHGNSHPNIICAFCAFSRLRRKLKLPKPLKRKPSPNPRQRRLSPKLLHSESQEPLPEPQYSTRTTPPIVSASSPSLLAPYPTCQTDWQNVRYISFQISALMM